MSSTVSGRVEAKAELEQKERLRIETEARLEQRMEWARKQPDALDPITTGRLNMGETTQE